MFFCVANFGLPTLAYGLAGLGMAGHEEVIQVRLIKKIEEERYKKKFFLVLKRLLLTSGLVFGRMFCLCRPRLTFGYMQVSQINVRFLSIFCHINGKRLFSLKETFDRKIALLLKKSHSFALMLNELNFFRFYFIFFRYH